MVSSDEGQCFERHVYVISHFNTSVSMRYHFLLLNIRDYTCIYAPRKKNIV